MQASSFRPKAPEVGTTPASGRSTSRRPSSVRRGVKQTDLNRGGHHMDDQTAEWNPSGGSDDRNPCPGRVRRGQRGKFDDQLYDRTDDLDSAGTLIRAGPRHQRHRHLSRHVQREHGELRGDVHPHTDRIQRHWLHSVRRRVERLQRDRYLVRHHAHAHIGDCANTATVSSDSNTITVTSFTCPDGTTGNRGLHTRVARVQRFRPRSRRRRGRGAPDSRR